MTITLPPLPHREMIKTIARMIDQVGKTRGVYLVYPSPSDEARQMLQGSTMIWRDFSRIRPVNPELMEVQFLNRSRFQKLMDSTGQGHDGDDVIKLIDAMDPDLEVLVAVAASRIYLWSREQVRQMATSIREVEYELLVKHRMPTQGVDAAPEHIEARSDDHLMKDEESVA